MAQKWNNQQVTAEWHYEGYVKNAQGEVICAIRKQDQSLVPVFFDHIVDFWHTFYISDTTEDCDHIKDEQLRCHLGDWARMEFGAWRQLMLEYKQCVYIRKPHMERPGLLTIVEPISDNHDELIVDICEVQMHREIAADTPFNQKYMAMIEEIE
jgi:hypothetical protein